MISRDTADKLSYLHERIGEAKYLLNNLEELKTLNGNKDKNGTIDYLGNKVRYVPYTVIQEMLSKIIKINETELELLEFQVLEELKK